MRKIKFGSVFWENRFVSHKIKSYPVCQFIWIFQYWQNKIGVIYINYHCQSTDQIEFYPIWIIHLKYNYVKIEKYESNPYRKMNHAVIYK